MERISDMGQEKQLSTKKKKNEHDQKERKTHPRRRINVHSSERDAERVRDVLEAMPVVHAHLAQERHGVLIGFVLSDSEGHRIDGSAHIFLQLRCSLPS